MAELPIREPAIDPLAEPATRQHRDRLAVARITLAIKASGAVPVPVAAPGAAVQVLVPKAVALVAAEVAKLRTQAAREAEAAWVAAGSAAAAEAAVAIAAAEEGDGDN